jgi:hypothetical protein
MLRRRREWMLGFALSCDTSNRHAVWNAAVLGDTAAIFAHFGVPRL